MTAAMATFSGSSTIKHKFSSYTFIVQILVSYMHMYTYVAVLVYYVIIGVYTTYAAFHRQLIEY